MRPNRAILTIGACAAAVLGVPAAVAATAKAPAPALAEAAFPDPREAATTTAAVGRKARGDARERQGPVHPLVGQPDYGTAENAYGAARSGHMHSGQDVFAPAGTPLVAVAGTEVIEAGTDGAQGNYAHLYDAEADRTYVYMHMVAPPAVKAGDRLIAGQRIGGVGCTGSCWGDHLHFEVRSGRGWGGEAQDPMPLLQGWPRAGSG
jgi:murein DD-endopeptidase MepM/ murein hydrolase activator NlpD